MKRSMAMRTKYALMKPIYPSGLVPGNSETVDINMPSRYEEQ
jgi:hypothetical protein